MNLRTLLAALYIDAYQHPGIIYKRTLRNGLTIGFRFTDPCNITLFISRQEKPPSNNEWKIILNHLIPAILPDDTDPTTFVQNMTHFKYLTWELDQ